MTAVRSSSLMSPIFFSFSRHRVVEWLDRDLQRLKTQGLAPVEKFDGR